jgi:hypothetical protein
MVPKTNNQFPQGMSQRMMGHVRQAIDNARVAGWCVGAIRWEDQPSRMVEFSARHENGHSVYTACPEENLLERIQELASPDDWPC